MALSIAMHPSLHRGQPPLDGRERSNSLRMVAQLGAAVQHARMDATCIGSVSKTVDDDIALDISYSEHVATKPWPGRGCQDSCDPPEHDRQRIIIEVASDLRLLFGTERHLRNAIDRTSR
eukprot:scaffold92985_cov30-Tisochrysis_lutea.AAC.1